MKCCYIKWLSKKYLKSRKFTLPWFKIFHPLQSSVFGCVLLLDSFYVLCSAQRSSSEHHLRGCPVQGEFKCFAFISSYICPQLYTALSGAVTQVNNLLNLREYIHKNEKLCVCVCTSKTTESGMINMLLNTFSTLLKNHWHVVAPFKIAWESIKRFVWYHKLNTQYFQNTKYQQEHIETNTHNPPMI